MANNFTNFGVILSGPVALLGFIFRMILLISLTDALGKWNEPYCERFWLALQSMIGVTIPLSVNEGLMAICFDGIPSSNPCITFCSSITVSFLISISTLIWTTLDNFETTLPF